MEGAFYFEGVWSKEAPKTAGPADQGFWQATSVFMGHVR